jgi:hypothetical protein
VGHAPMPPTSSMSWIKGAATQDAAPIQEK